MVTVNCPGWTCNPSQATVFLWDYQCSLEGRDSWEVVSTSVSSGLVEACGEGQSKRMRPVKLTESLFYQEPK